MSELSLVSNVNEITRRKNRNGNVRLRLKLLSFLLVLIDLVIILQIYFGGSVYWMRGDK